MPEYLFDQKKAIDELHDFFKEEQPSLSSFGSTVNQTFEAKVFSNVIKWYRKKGYKVEIVNPKVDGQPVFRLKFSIRGAPKRYSYAVLIMDDRTIQLRHQLRVSTSSNKDRQNYSANICCDIVVMQDMDLSDFTTETPIPNDWLITFGEVKHMSIFAELIANFIGLVHELAPSRLKKLRKAGYESKDIAPFLYASGIMFPTAKGILETIKRRKYDIEVYSFRRQLVKEEQALEEEVEKHY